MVFRYTVELILETIQSRFVLAFFLEVSWIAMRIIEKPMVASRKIHPVEISGKSIRFSNIKTYFSCGI